MSHQLSALSSPQQTPAQIRRFLIAALFGGAPTHLLSTMHTQERPKTTLRDSSESGTGIVSYSYVYCRRGSLMDTTEKLKDSRYYIDKDKDGLRV